MSVCYFQTQVLVEWRAKDPNHVPWVASIKELLQGLKVRCGCQSSRVLRPTLSVAVCLLCALPACDPGCSVLGHACVDMSALPVRLPAGLLRATFPSWADLECRRHSSVPVQAGASSSRRRRSGSTSSGASSSSCSRQEAGRPPAAAPSAASRLAAAGTQASGGSWRSSGGASSGRRRRQRHGSPVCRH